MAQPNTAQMTSAGTEEEQDPVTRASAYWPGNSAGRRGAMVRRLTRRHMGPWWPMEEAFGIVIFAVVAVSAVLAVVSLFFRGRTYDEIGRGGIGDDRETGRRPQGGAVDLGDRDAEIRQMLEARNARHAARGEAQVDVEDELARLTAPAADPALREEVRELVIARNARREGAGSRRSTSTPRSSASCASWVSRARSRLLEASDSVRSSRLASASGSRRSAITDATIPIAKATNTIASVNTGPIL